MGRLRVVWSERRGAMPATRRTTRAAAVNATARELDDDRSVQQGRQQPILLSGHALPYCLAFAAGWFDVVCSKQYRCYANMMTGNTLNLLMKVSDRDFADAPLLASVIAVFCAGYMFFKVLDSR